MELALAPHLRHADQVRQCVTNRGDNGEREKADADAVPSVGDVKIHCDTSQHGDRGERVRLPAQFIELEAAIYEREN